jgi:hypothetical protein
MTYHFLVVHPFAGCGAVWTQTPDNHGELRIADTLNRDAQPQNHYENRTQEREGGRVGLPSASSQTRGEIVLRHFDNSLQLWLTFAIRCARVLGAEQTGRDPQSVHFFADTYQLLLLRS